MCLNQKLKAELFWTPCTPVEFIVRALFQIEMGPKLAARCMLAHLMLCCDAIQELSIGFHRSAACRFEMNIIFLWKLVRWFRCSNHGMHHASVLPMNQGGRKNSFVAWWTLLIC